MKKSLFIVLCVLSTVVITGVVFTYLFLSELETEEIRNEIKLNYPKLNEELVFNSRLWGLAGNHEEIVLSGKETNESKESNYVFYTTELYYLAKDDSLIIYTNPSFVNAPLDFNSPVKILLKDLNTSSELVNYKDNYKKYGLKKFSAFNE